MAEVTEAGVVAKKCELLPISWTEKFSYRLVGSSFVQSRSSLSESQRERLVELFEQGMGYQVAARVLGVRRDPVVKLYHRFRLHGRLCLVQKRTKQQYSFETKKEVVQRFLAGPTRQQLAREYQLSADEIVTKWVSAWRKDGDENAPWCRIFS